MQTARSRLREVLPSRNGSGIADARECTGDLVPSRIVDSAGLGLLLAHWGRCGRSRPDGRLIQERDVAVIHVVHRAQDHQFALLFCFAEHSAVRTQFIHLVADVRFTAGGDQLL